MTEIKAKTRFLPWVDILKNLGDAEQLSLLKLSKRYKKVAFGTQTKYFTVTEDSKIVAYRPDLLRADRLNILEGKTGKDGAIWHSCQVGDH